MTSSLWNRYQAWTASDVVAMKGVEQENRLLDFKLLSKPDFGKDDQQHLAKAGSGFANAQGGVVLWGVDARRDPNDDHIDQVISTPGVDNPRQILARLNELASVATAPGVAGLDHRIIDGQGATPSFVATFVPEGESGPYMAMLAEVRHRYYRRIVSAFVPMDHSRVADMFGRRARPVLQLELQPIETGNPAVRAIVSNVGRGIARAPYLLLKAAAPLEALALDVHSLQLHRGPRGWASFGEDLSTVIHPGLSRMWVPLRTTLTSVPEHHRTRLHTIAYRLGAADIPEVSGRFVMTFEPAKVAFHELVPASEL